MDAGVFTALQMLEQCAIMLLVPVGQVGTYFRHFRIPALGAQHPKLFYSQFFCPQAIVKVKQFSLRH